VQPCRRHDKRGLTLRSSGPPASRLGCEALRSMLRLAAQAPSGRGPFSSNVRHHQPRRRHAHRNLSLRSRAHPDSPSATLSQRLQLLGLPSLRNTVGLLPAIRGAGSLRARLNPRLRLGEKGTSVCQVRNLWLCHTLGASQAQGRCSHGSQRSQLRSRGLGASTYRAARRCVRLEGS
jgi:hypothetical protein